MKSETEELSERFLDYAARCIKLTSKINRNAAGKIIANQLIRSSSSVGANYEEACGAGSKPDFIHKMHLVLKEIRESLYWIKLLQRSELIQNKNIQLLQNESYELVKIVSKSVITAKGSR